MRQGRTGPINAKVNLDQQFGRFHNHWSPRIVGTVNDYDVKLVKVQGEFVWHQHQDTDELSWSSTASCASSSKPTITSSSGRASCSWCHVGCATVQPPTGDPCAVS
jgi:hypothetical protein